VDGLPSAEVKGFKIAYDPGASIPVDFGLEGIYSTQHRRGGPDPWDGRLIKSRQERVRRRHGCSIASLALRWTSRCLPASTPPRRLPLLLPSWASTCRPPSARQSGLGLFGAQGLLGITSTLLRRRRGQELVLRLVQGPPFRRDPQLQMGDKYLALRWGPAYALYADGFTVLTAPAGVALPGPSPRGGAARLPDHALRAGRNPPLRALMVLDLRESSRSIHLHRASRVVEGVLFARRARGLQRAEGIELVLLGARTEAMRIQARS